MTRTAESKGRPEEVSTDIPARLDRLPWSRFHWLLVTALGVTWVLDGLEATVVASISPVLQKKAALGLTDHEVGYAGTSYLAGAILGALVFGHLTDRLGRKRLFSITLGVYLVGASLTALAWDFTSFALFRFLTGMAIGGEYSAINSAIDELIPARLRGRVDLAVNGTYWLGAAAGSLASLFLLDPQRFAVDLGWRLAFGLGVVVGTGMIVARRFVPESPRWLLMHDRGEEAEKVTRTIEESACGGEQQSPPPAKDRVSVKKNVEVGFGDVVSTMLVEYRSRAFLGLMLIASQAFFYNGIFFTYPLVLKHFFQVPNESTGRYMLYFAAANFCGPLLLGRLFDTLGRRLMISATYSLAAVLIIVTEVLFIDNKLTAQTQTLLWAVTFFFASAAASAGYLTVSEIFPMQMRALAIALFYVIGTAVGGLLAPALFGHLIETHLRGPLVFGYLLGAALMLFAALTEAVLGVASEQKSLEKAAKPSESEKSDGEGLKRDGEGGTMK